MTEQAYIADVQHLNRPNGLFIDSSDNLYVVEGWGSRMLKYRTSDGNNLLSIGTAGLNIVGDDTFYEPQDVTVDGSGNIWAVDMHRATQFDGSGNFLQVFPDWDNEPWASGDDSEHFDTPCGIAFDSAGRMYVSDSENHRVQVYTFVGGSPVYSTTIGVTGVSSNDNAHFNWPARIVIDSSDRLYVADVENYRVQRCTYAAGWTCATFHGTGSEGSGPNELSWAFGLGIDSSDNIYIADGGNARVKKCDSGGSCSTFASGFDWPADVAVDSASNVYVSDWFECTIRKYNSSGVFQGIFAGTSDVPYLTDNSHFNAPYGVAVDSSGNIYLSTTRGYRVLKLNASGTAQWAVGTAGVWGNDNIHFGDVWDGPDNVAVDSNGNVYVADTGNHRIQIYNSSGSYVATLGSYGSSNYQFDRPEGVAVDGSGKIYVADTNNHRVQIYNSSRVYVATLGVTGSPGTDNSHFNYPVGVAVDTNGNIYVVDADNHRVQVFNSSFVHQLTIGETGVSGGDFGHLHYPQDVAVDASGRIYVVDDWGLRIQVFDSNGDYLTTIGGSWGSGTGELRGARGVALDNAGNVYVADSNNARIQKFAPGVPGWEQVNINGFGDAYNKGWSSAGVYSSSLYIATTNEMTGCEIWRASNGTSWTQVNSNGFGDPDNVAVYNMVDFNDHFYVGTRNENTGGELWRCPASSGCDGPSDWSQVGGDGLGDPNNSDAEPEVEFGGYLYVDTTNWVSGTRVYSSSNGTTWTQVNNDGFGDANNGGGTQMAVFGGYLYLGTWNDSTGGELWRCQTCDGSDWGQVGDDGLGDSDNWGLFPLTEFNGGLYVGVYNEIDGTRVYSSSNGTSWTQVNQDGFSDGNNSGVFRAAVLGNTLYVGTSNWTSGLEIWKTSDGTTWEQVPPDGFGDSNNSSASSLAVFSDNLYVATENWANGGELWQLAAGGQIYLPIILKNFSP